MPNLQVSQADHAILSPKAMAILRDVGDSAYRKLVVDAGSSTPNSAKALQPMTPDQMFIAQVKHPDDAAAALAGMWLWLDDLDACHKIAQDLVTSTGSFWHAVMHRREGDFSNAKYWYHRCNNHHVMKMLGAVASSIVEPIKSDRLALKVISGGWNADGLVDFVEALHDKPSDPRYEVAVKLQQLEWAGLFDYCIHQALEADWDGLDAWDKRVNSPS